MKIGIICEGSIDSDVLVFEYLIKKLNEKIRKEVKVLRNPLGNKKDIFKFCGKVSKNLLEIDKCDKVIIIWDLSPSWKTEDPKKPCLKEDREKVFKSLNDEKIDRSKVSLICIQAMLEAWLIADEEALIKFLSTKSHSAEVNKVKNPEKEKDPKARLIKVFETNKGFKYEESRHAIKIIELVDTKKLYKRCLTYQRFEEKLKL